jgi:RimJ/RimL family protein N-acetyltransferase
VQPFYAEVESSKVQVRRLNEDDAAALWELRLIALETDPQAFRETAQNHRATPVAVYRERLRASDDSAVFGAFEHERLFGMAGVHRMTRPNSDMMRIWGMFVLSHYRGLGAGNDVLAAAVEFARSKPGITAIELSVAATQEAAQRMYLRHGFEPTGTLDDIGNQRMVARWRASSSRKSASDRAT